LGRARASYLNILIASSDLIAVTFCVGNSAGKLYESPLSVPAFSIFLPALLLILVASEPAWARPKLDVLTTYNGDHITCEIIRLERGYLYVRLDYGDGMVSLNWSNVARVDSPQQFIVTDENGRRSTGTLQKFAIKAGQPEEQVASKSQVPPVHRAEVVEFDPLTSASGATSMTPSISASPFPSKPTGRNTV
jgi:hypothetical protein